jgi:hypothetical protein
MYVYLMTFLLLHDSVNILLYPATNIDSLAGIEGEFHGHILWMARWWYAEGETDISDGNRRSL